MQIVVEYVLLENFIICLLVLKSVSLLAKEEGKLFWLSSMLSAAVALCMPALYMGVFGSFLLQFGMAFVYVSICFKFKTINKFIKFLLLYFLVNFIYGGACFFVGQLAGETTLLTILLVVVCTYCILKFVCKYLNKKKGIDNFCFDVEIESAGKRKKFRAFLDSGNLLYDPVTESPVSLINFKAFSTLYDDIKLEDVLRKGEKLQKLRFAHYISMGTLSTDGKILVFQADKICVAGQTLEKPILGLSLTSFNQAFGSDVILHNNFASL